MNSKALRRSAPGWGTPSAGRSAPTPNQRASVAEYCSTDGARESSGRRPCRRGRRSRGSGYAPVHAPAADGAAHDEVMGAPAVIGARAVGHERAAEVRRRERRHVCRDAEFDRGRVERRERAAQLGEQAAWFCTWSPCVS